MGEQRLSKLELCLSESFIPYSMWKNTKAEPKFNWGLRDGQSTTCSWEKEILTLDRRVEDWLIFGNLTLELGK